MKSPRVIVDVRQVVSEMWRRYNGDKSMKQWARLKTTQEELKGKFSPYLEDLAHTEWEVEYDHDTKEIYITSILTDGCGGDHIGSAAISADVIGERIWRAGLVYVVQK